MYKAWYEWIINNEVSCTVTLLTFTCLMFSLSLSLSLCLFQVLSYIAKGSFGPILKVKDKIKQKTYAVKVSSLPQPHTGNVCVCFTDQSRQFIHFYRWYVQKRSREDRQFEIIFKVSFWAFVPLLRQLKRDMQKVAS